MPLSTPVHPSFDPYQPLGKVIKPVSCSHRQYWAGWKDSPSESSRAAHPWICNLGDIYACACPWLCSAGPCAIPQGRLNAHSPWTACLLSWCEHPWVGQPAKVKPLQEGMDERRADVLHWSLILDCFRWKKPVLIISGRPGGHVGSDRAGACISLHLGMASLSKRRWNLENVQILKIGLHKPNTAKGLEILMANFLSTSLIFHLYF